MDDATLESLRQAHRASPENLPLLALLAKGLHESGQTSEACELLAGATLDGLEGADRRTAAEVLLAGDRAEAALTLADGQDPEARLLRARVLLELGREAEGRDCYREALGANSALEDPELEALLATQQAVVRSDENGDERPVLRLLAAGDEKDEEIDLLVAPAQEPVTFEDVGGLDHVKKQMHRRIILPFKKPSLFQRFKRRAGGGILLFGPPGCGKTLLARAVAGECDAEFFNVAISDVLDMWMGESERKLAALFEKARQSAPSVIFFDEVEGLGGRRQHSGGDSAAKLVSTFLSEMDGFARDNHGVLVLGATNVPWNVDAAFRRPGRFDRFLFVPPPDEGARRRILEIHLEDRPGAEALDVKSLVKKTSGFSGADLAELVNTACDLAIEESLAEEMEIPLRAAHLLGALKELRPTTLEWLTTARNHARYANEGGQYDEVLAFLSKHGKK